MKIERLKNEESFDLICDILIIFFEVPFELVEKQDEFFLVFGFSEFDEVTRFFSVGFWVSCIHLYHGFV